jgi:hypothetical protein
MDLSVERLRLLAKEAHDAKLTLPALADRLLGPPAHGETGALERMLAFAAEERFTLGEELRLRDLLKP